MTRIELLVKLTIKCSQRDVCYFTHLCKYNTRFLARKRIEITYFLFLLVVMTMRDGSVKLHRIKIQLMCET